MSAGVKDRFSELIQAQNTEDENVTINIDNENVSPEFKDVFNKVYEIRNSIENIKENTRKIKQIVQTNNSFSTKSNYDEIEVRVKNTYDIAFKITNELKELDVKQSKKNNDNDKTTIARIKRIQYGALRQDFQNALFESNEFLEKYKNQKRDILKKQAKLVNANIQNEELERLLDNPDSVQLFTDNILMHTQLAKDQLSQMEERHQELLKIEDMLVEVNNQFKQIAILIEQQKDHINRIEFHACDAIDYVDKGLLDIQKAETNRKKAKKKIYIAIVLVIVVILIIVILLK